MEFASGLSGGGWGSGGGGGGLFTQFQILNIFLLQRAVLCPLTAVHSAFCFLALYWLSDYLSN